MAACMMTSFTHAPPDCTLAKTCFVNELSLLNTYTTSDEREDMLVEWERTYRPFLHLVPPRIVDVDVTVELWPETRSYSLDGRYTMVNKTDAPIDSVVLNYDQSLTVERVDRARAEASD